MRKITLMLLIVLFATYANAGTYYVTLNGSGTKDGSSWANANAGEAGIAAGITASASAGGDIWVAAGTYTHSTTMTITDKVNIYGGFAGTESDKGQRTKGTNAWDYTNATILSGGTTQVFTLAGNLATGAIIDGFTFTGNTSTTQGSIAQTRGNVTIQNCIFSGNTTSAANGATVNMLGGTLSYCYIYNNTATAAVAGGGIPGGIYSNPSTGVTTSIDHCLIDKNTGGGLRCQGTAMTYVNACIFRRNLSVTTNGGATLAPGGAIYTNSGNNRFTNCLIYNNSGGNVIYANGGEFTNNTICNNEGQFRFANTTGSNVEKAHNNIVWGNLATVGGTAVGFSVAAATGGTNTVQNNLVSVAVGTAPTGTTYTANVLTATDNTGVLFASPTASVGYSVSDAVVNAADWHINSGSGAINIGNNSLIPSGITTDFAGNNRTYNTTVDAGAYEYQWVSTPVTVTNNGFEDALANFTISELGANMLYRVNGTWATTTTTGNPTASSVSVTNGLWVKRALNTTYIKAVVVSSDVHGGSNSLNLAINSGSASTGLDTWSNILAQQKISLSNTEKYTISFWAKVDAASSNSATKVVVFVTDNTLKTLLSCAIPLTGGTTWTQYSATFDIPTFKAANSTADFTNAYIGVGLPATYDATSLKTNYSGVLLDDFSVNTANTGTVVVTTAAGANGNVTGSGTVYVAGSTATVVATPNSGYTFTGWSDGASTVSTNPTYTFTANSNASLTASFAATTLTTTGTLNSFTTVYGTTSTEQTFTVSGTNLVSNIIITPPTGFEISTTSGSGYQSTALIIAPSSGTVNAKTIYVRVKSTASATAYSAIITVATLGMTTQNVACAATVSQAPLTITGISIANKVFDGSNAASITGIAAYSGLVNGEAPAIAGTPVATFSDEIIGDGKSVSVSGYSAPTANYSIAQPTGLTANIYPATSTFSNSGVSNWSTATEWTYAPISSTNLVVSSGELVVDQDAAVNSVTVSPGAKLTLSAGKTLSVGTVTLNSDATGTATFVDNGNSTVNAVVNQYLTAGRNWYMSIPVASVDSSAMSSAQAIVCYNEPTASWISPQSATLSPLRGYISTSTKTTGAVSFSGTLNTGDKSIVLTRTPSVAKSGFNLLGNPYPSYLDWSLASAANPGVMSTIWYRTKTATAYTFDTYNAVGNMHTNNGLTTVSNLIPPMQAFWVRVNEGQPTATITFTNAMRSHADVSANRMKTPAMQQATQQVLRLQVSNGVNSDETIVLFNPNATNGIDDFDSPKMTNNNASIPELYTVAGNQQLVINGLNSITPNEEITLGFTSGQSNVFTLKATEISNFDSGMQIVLKDNLLNSEQLLTVGADYSFTSDATSNTSRFSLVFKSPSLTTGLNENTGLKNILVKANKNHQISISYLNTPGNTDCAEVYNSVGQQLTKQQLNNSVTLLRNRFESGVYVVVLYIHGEKRVEKVTIN